MSGEPSRLAILEAVLFVTEEPLPLAKLQEILGDELPEATAETVRALALALEEAERGLLVQEVAGGFRLTTRPEAHPWIVKLQQIKPARLSRAALETLAIIAYRQPITRAEVEAIRGVAIDGVLKTLLERELVRMLGRKPEAGRPMLYGTSPQFLEHFGLRDLSDLPTLREINELIGISESEAEPREAAAPPITEGEPGPEAPAPAGPTDAGGEDAHVAGAEAPAVGGAEDSSFAGPEAPAPAGPADAWPAGSESGGPAGPADVGPAISEDGAPAKSVDAAGAKGGPA